MKMHLMTGPAELKELGIYKDKEQKAEEQLRSARINAPRGVVAYRFHKAHVNSARANYRIARTTRLNFQRLLNLK